MKGTKWIVVGWSLLLFNGTMAVKNSLKGMWGITAFSTVGVLCAVSIIWNGHRMNAMDRELRELMRRDS